MEEDGLQDLTKGEVIKAIRKLKKAKASGEDEIENEVWKLMPMEIGEELLKLLNKIWRGGGLPRDWRRGIINPIFEKGDRKAVKNYRGVTLLSTAYKIYADIINGRLKMQVQDQLEEGQVRF